MKMRLKTQVLILAVIFFIFFISYKILEPELQDGDLKRRSSLDYMFQDRREVNDEEREEQRNADVRVQHYLSLYDLNWNLSTAGPLWQVAESWVEPRQIHPEYAPEIGPILRKISTAKILRASNGQRGTQLKMTLTLDGGQKVVFKPKWFEREDVIHGKPYDGPDRHNGEIAAFHLNRLMGFRRSPLVAGRVVNMETEIRPVAEQSLLDTFYTKDDNTCFYGKCYYCKGKDTGVCGQGHTMEGAVVLWLPKSWKLKNWRHPWQRTYRKDIKALWETDATYCDKVMNTGPYDDGPRLMDIVDASVFDYLIGNADRHHYETFTDYPESMLLMLDSAKSFGNPDVDERTILAPLYQCCRIRRPTWERLYQLRHGVLSRVLRQLSSHDPIAPVLSQSHYTAMDRRLNYILSMVETCIEEQGPHNIFVIDLYSENDDYS